jgi:hypothetical protein
MRRALAIDEKSFGAEHPDVARDLNNLAQLLKATNRLAETEPLMRRALAIFVATLGADHPNSQSSTVRRRGCDKWLVFGEHRTLAGCRPTPFCAHRLLTGA